MGFQNYVANENRRVRARHKLQYGMIRDFKANRRKWRIKKVIVLSALLAWTLACAWSEESRGAAFVPFGLAFWYLIKWLKQEEDFGDTL